MFAKKSKQKNRKNQKKIFETFVGENRVTRDSRLTPEHCWDGSYHLKVSTRVNWFSNWVEKRYQKILKKIEIKMEEL